MKCPKCGIELSDEVATIHINSKWCEKVEEKKKETKTSKEK